MSERKVGRRGLRLAGWLLGIVVAAIAALVIVTRHAPTPTQAGAPAEALAHDMVRAVDGDAWARTGAVRWRVFGHAYLWDKSRNLARVAWGRNRVLLDVANRRGRAWRDGEEVTDDGARKQFVERAYAFFINDSFWLNPVVKAFDDGTSRATGTVDGKRALLVSYASGGLTPGDRYLWILGDDGKPERWRLWVHVIPIGGIEITWEGWTQLGTGAWVSTRHRALGIEAIRIRDLAGAATLPELLPGADPFGPLMS